MPAPALRRMDGPNKGRVSFLKPEGSTLGRQPGCELRVEEEAGDISRRHAKIWRQGQTWWVQDLKSAHGSFLNDRRIGGPMLLPPGAVLRLGRTVSFTFEMATPPHKETPPIDPGHNKNYFTWIAYVMVMFLPLLCGGAAAVGWAGWQLHRQHVAAETSREALWVAYLDSHNEELTDEVEVDPALLQLFAALADSNRDATREELSARTSLEQHIAEILNRLVGQSTGRRIDPGFVEKVRRELRGLLGPKATCYCRFQSIREELTARFREGLIQVGGDPNHAEILVYIPWVESCYRTEVCSPAKALGMWQFISKSANKHGLRVDRSCDERCNWHKATRAAASHFKSNFDECGKEFPLLAIGRYNAGQACSKAKKKVQAAGQSDFYAFIKEDVLAPETAAYVPRFIAATFLGMHPSNALEEANRGQAGRGILKADTMDCSKRQYIVPVAADCNMETTSQCR